MEPTPQWYKDAVIYQLHVKAFNDANGDGIGDFEGLRQKLDYLQDLGINTIWMLPFYPSPLRDDGYDIADYYNVNPDYGTLEDFVNFLNDAHLRGSSLPYLGGGIFTSSCRKIPKYWPSYENGKTNGYWWSSTYRALRRP